MSLNIGSLQQPLLPTPVEFLSQNEQVTENSDEVVSFTQEDKNLVKWHLERQFTLNQQQKITPKEVYERLKEICPARQIYLHGSALPISRNTFAAIAEEELKSHFIYQPGIYEPELEGTSTTPIDYDAFYQLENYIYLETLKNRLVSIFPGAKFTLRNMNFTMKIGEDHEHFDLTFGWEVPFIDDTVCVGILGEELEFRLLGSATPKKWALDKLEKRVTISRETWHADFSWYLRLLCKMAKGCFPDDLHLIPPLRRRWECADDALLERGLINTCKNHFPDTEEDRLAFWLTCCWQLHDKAFLASLCVQLRVPERFKRFRDETGKMMHALRVGAFLTWMSDKKTFFKLRHILGGDHLVYEIAEQSALSGPSVFLSMDRIREELDTFHLLPEKFQEFALSFLLENKLKADANTNPFSVFTDMWQVFRFVSKNPKLNYFFKEKLLAYSKHWGKAFLKQRPKSFADSIRTFIKLDGNFAFSLWLEMPEGEEKNALLLEFTIEWDKSELGWKRYLTHRPEMGFGDLQPQALDYVLLLANDDDRYRQLGREIVAMKKLQESQAIELATLYLEKDLEIAPLLSVSIEPSNQLLDGDIVLYRKMANNLPNAYHATQKLLQHFYPKQKLEIVNLFNELKPTLASCIAVFGTKKRQAFRELSEELLENYSPTGDLQLFKWALQKKRYALAEKEYHLMKKKPLDAIDHFLEGMDQIADRSELFLFCKACGLEKIYYKHLLQEKNAIISDLPTIEALADDSMAKACREVLGYQLLENSKLLFQGVNQDEKKKIYTHFLEQSFPVYCQPALREGIDIAPFLLKWGPKQTYATFSAIAALIQHPSLKDLIESIEMILLLREGKDFTFKAASLEFEALIESLERDQALKLLMKCTDQQTKKLVNCRKDLVQPFLSLRSKDVLQDLPEKLSWKDVFLGYKPSMELCQEIAFSLASKNKMQLLIKLFEEMNFCREAKAGYYDAIKTRMRGFKDMQDLPEFEAIWKHINTLFLKIKQPNEEDAKLIVSLAYATHHYLVSVGKIYDEDYPKNIFPIREQMIQFLIDEPTGVKCNIQFKAPAGTVQKFDCFPAVKTAFVRPFIILSVVPAFDLDERGTYYYVAACYYYNHYKLQRNEKKEIESMLLNFEETYNIFNVSNCMTPLVRATWEMLPKLSPKRKLPPIFTVMAIIPFCTFIACLLIWLRERYHQK